jgi:bile acid:Na+ symporter, BASS family
MRSLLNCGILGVTILLMMTVGAELQVRDFREVVRRKGLLLGILLLPAALLPVIGFALARILALPPHLMAGILLLAACPVGDIANFYTLLARGNLALSVASNVLSCLLSVLTMASAFALYDHLLGEHHGFMLPRGTIVMRLTLLIAAPVLTGMMMRYWKPVWVARCRVTLRNLCLAGVAFLVTFVLVNRWTEAVNEWWRTSLAAIIFMMAAFALGLAMARLLRLTASDSITLGIVVSVRNVALASAIAVTMLNRIEFAAFAVVYFLTEVPFLMGVVIAYRRVFTSAPSPTSPIEAQA